MAVPVATLTFRHDGRVSLSEVVRGGRNVVAPRFRAIEHATTVTRSVPRVIPRGGVAVVSRHLEGGRRAVLMYLQSATAPSDSITQAQAEQDALAIDNAAWLKGHRGSFCYRHAAERGSACRCYTESIRGDRPAGMGSYRNRVHAGRDANRLLSDFQWDMRICRRFKQLCCLGPDDWRFSGLYIFLSVMF